MHLSARWVTSNSSKRLLFTSMYPVVLLQGKDDDNDGDEEEGRRKGRRGKGERKI